MAAGKNQKTQDIGPNEASRAHSAIAYEETATLDFFFGNTGVTDTSSISELNHSSRVNGTRRSKDACILDSAVSDSLRCDSLVHSQKFPAAERDREMRLREPGAFLEALGQEDR